MYKNWLIILFRRIQRNLKVYRNQIKDHVFIIRNIALRVFVRDSGNGMNIAVERIMIEFAWPIYIFAQKRLSGFYFGLRIYV